MYSPIHCSSQEIVEEIERYFIEEVLSEEYTAPEKRRKVILHNETAGMLGIEGVNNAGEICSIALGSRTAYICAPGPVITYMQLKWCK